MCSTWRMSDQWPKYILVFIICAILPKYTKIYHVYWIHIFWYILVFTIQFLRVTDVDPYPYHFGVSGSRQGVTWTTIFRKAIAPADRGIGKRTVGWNKTLVQQVIQLQYFFLLQRWNALPSHMFWSKRLAMISGSCLQATNLCSFTCMICALYIYIYISTLQVCIDTYRETNPHAIWHVCIYIYMNTYIHTYVYILHEPARTFLYRVSKIGHFWNIADILMADCSLMNQISSLWLVVFSLFWHIYIYIIIIYIYMYVCVQWFKYISCTIQSGINLQQGISPPKKDPEQVQSQSPLFKDWNVPYVLKRGLLKYYVWYCMIDYPSVHSIWGPSI